MLTRSLHGTAVGMLLGMTMLAGMAASGCSRCAPAAKPAPCHEALSAEVRARGKNMDANQLVCVSATLCEETRRMRLDPLLALALIDLESGYDAKSVSSQGALGLMQLMPATAVAVARRHGLMAPPGGPRDPVFNVRLGLNYLSDLQEEFPSQDHALVAYNIGPPAVQALLRKKGAAFDATGHPFVIAVTKRLSALRARYSVPPNKSPAG